MQPFRATLDNYELNILDISDTLNSAIAKHEYANTNGAQLYNMGNRPREIRFKTYWFGIGPTFGSTLQQPNYLNHYQFLTDMSDFTKDHELIHPKYGRIIGMVESLSTMHNDTQDYVEIDIGFVERDIKTTGFITDTQSIANKIEQIQIALVKADISRLNSQFGASGFSSILGKAVDASKSLAAQFRNVTNTVRDFLKECDTVINKFETIEADITAPISVIDNAIDFTADVPSRILGTFQHATDRVMSSFGKLSNLPAQFSNNVAMYNRTLWDSITGEHANFFRVGFASCSAGNLAAQSSKYMQADENNRATLAIQANKNSFDAAGNRINNVTTTPVMSVTDIELQLYIIRQYIQDVLDYMRVDIAGYDSNNQSLKEIAAALVVYVDTVKLQKQQIVSMTINNLPLHLLLNSLGQPYNSAEQILKLNPWIKNPTFTEGIVQVYANG